MKKLLVFLFVAFTYFAHAQPIQPTQSTLEERITALEKRMKKDEKKINQIAVKVRVVKLNLDTLKVDSDSAFNVINENFYGLDNRIENVGGAVTRLNKFKDTADKKMQSMSTALTGKADQSKVSNLEMLGMVTTGILLFVIIIGFFFKRSGKKSLEPTLESESYDR